MSSRYNSNNVENIRFGVLRNNGSTTDVFQGNQGKKMSIDPPSSDSQRNLMKVSYKCNKNRSSVTRGTNLSKNRSNSGIRNTTYLKSHQFLRTNNNGALQSFHGHVQNIGSSSNTSKNFSQSRKMSINQMKTVNNLDEEGKAPLDKDNNNYTSFHTSKQTSFRQSYVGVTNTSGSNIAYNHYSNMNNYSSLTNSSAKPGDASGCKDVQTVNALKIARKDIRGIEKRWNLSKSRSNRSSSMSQSKSISRKKTKRSSDK